MDKRFQVFISSTFEDLKNERESVSKACLRMGHIPVGMEQFNAGDQRQWDVIKRTIDLCDYYCVIVAHRYGSRGHRGISYTELEMRYAVAKGIPILAFIINDKANWPADLIDQSPADVASLRKLKSDLKKRMVSFWNNKDELASLFTTALNESIYVNSRPGWIRADGPLYENTLAEITRLSSDNERLRQELATISASSETSIRAARTSEQLTLSKLVLAVSKKDYLDGYIEVTLDEFLCTIAKDLSIGAHSWAIVELISSRTDNMMRSNTNDVVDALKELGAYGIVRVERFPLQGQLNMGQRIEQIFYITEFGQRIYEILQPRVEQQIKWPVLHDK